MAEGEALQTTLDTLAATLKSLQATVDANAVAIQRRRSEHIILILEQQIRLGRTP